jgi:hypothetical protein
LIYFTEFPKKRFPYDFKNLETQFTAFTELYPICFDFTLHGFQKKLFRIWIIFNWATSWWEKGVTFCTSSLLPICRFAIAKNLTTFSEKQQPLPSLSKGHSLFPLFDQNKAFSRAI